MILHVTFSDGSNPWVSLPTDRHTIAKYWRRWMKYHPATARPVASCGNWECYPNDNPGGVGYFVRNRQHPHMGDHYKRLGDALAALERWGGERP